MRGKRLINVLLTEDTFSSSNVYSGGRGGVSAISEGKTEQVLALLLVKGKWPALARAAR